MVGKTILHYNILEKLGEGGMGVVYKAQDTRLRRAVALKLLRSEYTEDAQIKARFQREAEATANLNHPNVVTVFDVGEYGKSTYIAMEYIDGVSLREVISQKELSIQKAVELVAQMGQGLSKAHRLDMVHRDIKPENILIDSDGCVKIVDFGLAKLKDRSRITSDATTLGTLNYMSPEQVRSSNVDQRSDIFSLGIVLYEMITGQLPFKGDYDAAVSYAILHEEPEPLARYKTGIPEEMQRVVDKALQKDLDTRYQHIDELVADLELLKRQFAAGGAERYGAQPRATAPGKQRVFLLLAVLISVILFSSLALYFWQSTLQQARRTAAQAVSSEWNRIAVLPLINISQDEEDVYFVDGMTEELISTLSKITGLKVIARTSVVQYKGTKKSVAEIGRELKVGHVIEGSVRKVDDKLRITLQLIHAQTQEHRWSKGYDRELTDIFAIQSDVAKQVAEALTVALLEGEKRRLEKKMTENFEAYDLYLRGRTELYKFTEDGPRKAIAYFTKAIEQDPRYAAAYAGLADAYYGLSNIYLPPEEAMPQARAAANKALEIDSSLSEAHAALATVFAFYDWNWLAAEREFKLAIELNPSYATAHHQYGIYLVAQGRFDAASLELNLARQLDPLSLSIEVTAAWPDYYGRDYQGAIAKLRDTIEKAPKFFPARLLRGLANGQLGQHTEAVAEITQAYHLSESPNLLANLGHAYAVAGMLEKAHKVLEELTTNLEQGEYITPYHMALMFIGLGNKDQAMHWLERAYTEKDERSVMMKVDPLLDSLRSDPRFLNLLRKMGYEAW